MGAIQTDVVMLVPKLQLGNPVLEAPASCPAKLELRLPNSQAGAWELAKSGFHISLNRTLCRRVRFKLMCGLNLEFIPYKGQAMTEPQMPSDEALMRSLNANPQIKNRIAALLAVVEDAAGDLKEADAAEMRLIEEIRRMGQEAMQAWAHKQNEITEQEVRRVGQVHREGKKNSAGIPPLVTSV